MNLVFNNAGYITTGLFADLALDRQLRNYEVCAAYESKRIVCLMKESESFVFKWKKRIICSMKESESLFNERMRIFC